MKRGNAPGATPQRIDLGAPGPDRQTKDDFMTAEDEKGGKRGGNASRGPERPDVEKKKTGGDNFLHDTIGGQPCKGAGEPGKRYLKLHVTFLPSKERGGDESKNGGTVLLQQSHPREIKCPSICARLLMIRGAT